MKQIYTILIALAFYTTSWAFPASPSDSAKGRFVIVDDVRIHYKIFGRGDDYLLLLHGTLESIRDWDKQIHDLAKRFHVVAIDNRGHGKSSFTDRKLDYALLSEDVMGVMQALKIDSAHIVGMGDGGIIGLYMAANHPEKVRKLVAIGANYKIDTTVVYREVMDKIKAWDEEKVYSFVRNNFRGWPNFALIKPFTERVKNMLLTEPNLTIKDLQKISCPTLFITGDHDIIKQQHTSEMFENVQNGYMAVIAGTRHYPQKEKPLVVNPIIYDFLSTKFVPLERF